MSKELISFYNQTKDSVDHQNGGQTNQRRKIISQWIPKNSKKILDIGCNDGSENLEFLRKGLDVYGVDISKEAVRRAIRVGVKARVLDIATQDIPYPPNTFDVVIAGEIIEHLIDTDKFLEKIYRVLKPGGKLVVTTPNLASFGRRLMLLLGKNPFIETSLKQSVGGSAPVGHIRYFTVKTLEDLLTANKFKIIETTSDNLSLGFLSSGYLAKIFPSLGWRLITLAKKQK